MAIRWEKLTVKSQQAMQQAQERATELGNPEMQPVHLLLALIEDREGVIPAVLEKIGVPTRAAGERPASIEEKLPRVAGSPAQPGISQGSIRLWIMHSKKPQTSRMNTFLPSTCCWARRT